MKSFLHRREALLRPLLRCLLPPEHPCGCRRRSDAPQGMLRLSDGEVGRQLVFGISFRYAMQAKQRVALQVLAGLLGARIAKFASRARNGNRHI